MGLPSPSFARALALLGALLAISALAVVGRLATAAHAAPVELFFSEYIEGSSNNKALEIYNGTGAPVTLTGTYDVQIFANGSALATATIPLTGTVADGDVFVLAQVNAVAAILAQADQTTSNFLFNGDDAVALRKAGTIVDVIGQIGSDPGTEWGSGATSTADNTLERKAVVQAGDANGSDAFDPATQWDGFALDTFSGLGAHSVSGGGGGPPGGGGGLNATDDAVTLEEDDEATPLGVLGNDSGSALTIVSVTDPANGSVNDCRRRRRRELRARRRLQRDRFVHVLRLGFERASRHGNGDCDGFTRQRRPRSGGRCGVHSGGHRSHTGRARERRRRRRRLALRLGRRRGNSRRRDGRGGRKARELRSRPRLERRRDTRVRRDGRAGRERVGRDRAHRASGERSAARPRRLGNGRRRSKCRARSSRKRPGRPSRRERPDARHRLGRHPLSRHGPAAHVRH